MLAIVDYGVGNLFSLTSSFKMIGVDAVVTDNVATIKKADQIILPGVGAFGDAAALLRETGLGNVVCDCAAAGKPLMGICLGMQLLFDKSYEYGEHEGLGLISGQVVPFEGAIAAELQIPHIGWNALKIVRGSSAGGSSAGGSSAGGSSAGDGSVDASPIFQNVADGDHVYFVHSYYAVDCEQNVIATVEYDINVTAAVQRKNVFGCQFHPEKSGTVGLEILRSFVGLSAGDFA